MVYGETGRFPLQLAVEKKMISYWLRIINEKQHKLTNLMYRLLFKLFESNTYRSSWLEKIKSILDKCGLPCIWINQNLGLDTRAIKTIIFERMKDIEINTWFSDVESFDQCSNYRIFKQVFTFEKYLVNLDYEDRLLFCRFRCGNHKLPITYNRHLHDSSVTLCHLCNMNCVADEYHYVLVCPNFVRLRTQYLREYYLYNPSHMKFSKLMNLSSGSEFVNLVRFIGYITSFFE